MVNKFKRYIVFEESNFDSGFIDPTEAKSFKTLKAARAYNTPMSKHIFDTVKGVKCSNYPKGFEPPKISFRDLLPTIPANTRKGKKMKGMYVYHK